MISPAEHRRFYARFVTGVAGVTEPRIIDAFATVRREHFLGPGPWKVPVENGVISTETADPAILYQNILICVDAERGINNGEPSLHARCLEAALPVPGEHVIHVGAGTGYYTAILAHLTGESGGIDAYEIDPDLAKAATQNLRQYPSVTVHAASAVAADLPAADVIYVCAGVTHIPASWLDALQVGGRLVLPLTPNVGPGFMLRVTRVAEAAYAARVFSVAYFIPCSGARDDEQSVRLAVAVATHTSARVRSLRREGAADESAWCIGTGWWLSTAEP
ncbi:MAG TPA: hypothetical protein VMF03_16715 [Steroidobacteraceae bacterium]|nr:hypothetical protein [Steroidobacteraceae bacterium]